MPIRYEHSEAVATTPDRAFAVIDDLSLTARWLPPCVSLTKVGDGPNAPGDRLRYVFTQGGRQGEMDGEIVARVPGGEPAAAQGVPMKRFGRVEELAEAAVFMLSDAASYMTGSVMTVDGGSTTR